LGAAIPLLGVARRRTFDCGRLFTTTVHPVPAGLRHALGRPEERIATFRVATIAGTKVPPTWISRGHDGLLCRPPSGPSDGRHSTGPARNAIASSQLGRQRTRARPIAPNVSYHSDPTGPATGCVPIRTLLCPPPSIEVHQGAADGMGSSRAPLRPEEEDSAAFRCATRRNFSKLSTEGSCAAGRTVPPGQKSAAATERRDIPLRFPPQRRHQQPPGASRTSLPIIEKTRGRLRFDRDHVRHPAANGPVRGTRFDAPRRAPRPSGAAYRGPFVPPGSQGRHVPPQWILKGQEGQRCRPIGAKRAATIEPVRHDGRRSWVAPPSRSSTKRLANATCRGATTTPPENPTRTGGCVRPREPTTRTDGGRVTLLRVAAAPACALAVNPVRHRRNTTRRGSQRPPPDGSIRWSCHECLWHGGSCAALSPGPRPQVPLCANDLGIPTDSCQNRPTALSGIGLRCRETLACSGGRPTLREKITLDDHDFGGRHPVRDSTAHVSSGAVNGSGTSSTGPDRTGLDHPGNDGRLEQSPIAVLASKRADRDDPCFSDKSHQAHGPRREPVPSHGDHPFRDRARDVPTEKSVVVATPSSKRLTWTMGQWEASGEFLGDCLSTRALLLTPRAERFPMDGTPTALMDDREFPSKNTMIICRRRAAAPNATAST
jgi:hypothetical protein